jgi:cob(I)alamin adenosyltransferase
LPSGFVVPGRSTESAALHVARSVCRRCERLVVAVTRQDHGHDALIPYFNRLSDLLFVLAWSLDIGTLVSDVVREMLSGSSQQGAQQCEFPMLWRPF